MQPYWRKMRVPWVPLTGIAAQLATTIAMRTSHEPEVQWSVLVPGGDTWVPEARTWNMNEGTFDQRESIFAPTPATLTYRLDVPPHARLRVSPAVLVPLPSTTVFDVTLVDAAGAEHAVSQTRIAGGEARRWIDVDADLGPYGGQRVELRLRTSLDKPAAYEKRWLPRQDDEADAGAAEPQGPPMALAFWGDPVVVAREPTRVP